MTYCVDTASVKAHLRLDSVTFATDTTVTQSIAPFKHVVAADVVGAAVDVLGKQCLFIVDAGDCTGGTVTVKIEDSPDNITYTLWATFDAITAANDNQIHEKAYTGVQRYVRAKYTVAGADSNFGVDIVTNSYTPSDEAYLETLIEMASDYTELYLMRSLITQTWEIWLDEWPEDPYEVRYPPLISVTSIKYYDTDNTEYTMDAADYYVDTTSEPGRIGLAYGCTWPSETLRPINGIKITISAGYGAAATDVPQAIRHAILLLIGHMYENREMVMATGAIPKEIPMSYKALLAPYTTYSF
jgi:uncharacterized phiE125 gp8 family phage protein